MPFLPPCSTFPAAAAVMAGLILAASPAVLHAAGDRDQKVRADRAALDGDDRWIYNDLDAGFREARSSGRPLFVTLRCIP